MTEAMKPAGCPGSYQPMARPRKPATKSARDAQQNRDQTTTGIAARHKQLGNDSDNQANDECA
jgi:hypothetical protein